MHVGTRVTTTPACVKRWGGNMTKREHGEYNGEKQTTVTRVTPIEDK